MRMYEYISTCVQAYVHTSVYVIEIQTEVRTLILICFAVNSKLERFRARSIHMYMRTYIRT